MSEALHVRRAGPSDAPVIADFNLRLAWETEHRRLDPEVVLAGVTAVLGDARKGIYFVVEPVRGGGVIGQGSITYEWSDWRNGDFWWLQSVYVAAEWRRRGVFTALFEAIRGEARTAGAAGLRLYVESDNARAQEAYQRHGMRQAPYRIFELEFPRPGAADPMAV